MASNTKVLSKDLVNILSSASDNKIYGSVEIYFEAGNVTQITQRIINKVSSVKKTHNQNTYSFKSDNKTMEINNNPKIKNDSLELPSVSRSF